jgi:hypothetical protein
VGPGHLAAQVSLAAEHPKTPDEYKAALDKVASLSHVTVEVNPVSGSGN